MKYIPYGRQSIDKSDIQAVIKVLESDWLTQGPKVEEFEGALARYCGARYALVVSSGTAALHLACLAAGIGRGDEVITSANTFVASANCVLYCQGKPVFADIDKETANILPGEIQKKINRRTKAVIPVHFAGHPSCMDEISKIAKRHKLIIIEDAAHALGAEYRGFKIGDCRYCDMVIFSFHPLKSITTGEGGAVLTNRRDLYLKIKALRSHGVYRDKGTMGKIGPWYYQMRDLGFNYRATDIQCALGISQLARVEDFINKRRRIAERYSTAFAGNAFFDIPEEKDGVRSSWHLYPIRLKDKYKKNKKYFFNSLRGEGIGVQVHYQPVYRHPYYQGLGYRRGECPQAEDFYEREISLPLSAWLGESDVDYAIRKVRKVFHG